MDLRTAVAGWYSRAASGWALRIGLSLIVVLLPLLDAVGASRTPKDQSDHFHLPDTLTRLDLSNAVNYVDLIGRGSAKDLIIRAMEQTGTVYSPLVTQVFIHDDLTRNTGWAEYSIVYMPKIFGREDQTIDSNAMNCFVVTSDFLQFPRNGKTETIMIRVIKDDSSVVGGKISIFVYRLEDAGSEADNVMYEFSEVAHKEIYSDACNPDDMDPIIENVFSTHIR